MNLLICGVGSIGKRHYNNLKKIGNINLFAYRTNKSTLSDTLEFEKIFYNIDEIIEYNNFDGVIICNPTSKHIETALSLASLNCPFFIEKPLGHSMDGVDKLKEHAENITYVLGYHVLFHPCFKKVKNIVEEGSIGDIISCKAYNGSYLPNWHPWEDYKKSYASNKSLGGGVILTMTHELNYLTSLFGNVDKCTSMISEKNILDIDVDENVEILLKHNSGVISNIHLNFFQKNTERWLKIIGTDGIIFWDLWKSEIVMNQETVKFDKEPIELLNQSYYDEIKYFLSICGKGNNFEIVKGTTINDAINDLDISIKLLENAL